MAQASDKHQQPTMQQAKVQRAKVSARFDSLGADGAPVKLGLMGGTFDPIHLGHLAMAERARKALGLDAVLFIPTGAPVFKRDRAVTIGEVRLEMVAAAVRDNPYFDASPIEVRRKGDTYTVDTLRELRAHYPDNVEFYFMVGSDVAADLWKWRAADEVAALTQIVVMQRPGHELSPAEEARVLEVAPFRFVRVEVAALDIASSDLRARALRGESIRYLVPEGALRVIRALGLYHPHRGEGGAAPFGAAAHASAAPVSFPLEDGAAGEAARGADALSDEFFEARRAQLRLRVKPKRFTHVMGVVDMATRIAQAYGADVARARLAALLHDWDKGFGPADIRTRARKLGVDVGASVVDDMPQLLHGPVAAAVLARQYPQIPADVLSAVARHTAGARNMSPLDMVVYVADAIEENRAYPGVGKLRAMVGQASLEELFVETFRHTLENLLDRGRTVHPATVDVWNYYAALNEGR